jgi:pSer/pThr/pTyr-binding forkhead associated (FHA) protein
MVDQPDPILGATFSGCIVDRKLGQGGMGSVYVARRLADQEVVVIKFLAAEQATDRVWRARFNREAEMVKRVSHANIVKTYSVDGECAQPHIVMEYVSGKGLDIILRDGPVAPMEAARIARDVSLALAEAHKVGIIHRDIKPANVLVTQANEVKVLDFGLAKNIMNDDGLSMPGQILGTPQYMAPEQWGEHDVDPRCDIYALGVTLYQLVTRQLPFGGASSKEIMRKVMDGTFPRPRSIVAAIPEDLELVILRMMVTDRRYRYASAEQCARDLDLVREGKPVDVPRLVEKASGKRHQLVSSALVTVGRDATCDVVILNQSISRQHARIERAATGYVLHDLGSTYGSFVEGMRVKDVVLKDGDQITFGKVAFEFRDGGAAKGALTRRIASDRMETRALPWPLVQALVDAADRRAVVALLEDLAPDFPEAPVKAARDHLREILGGDIAEAVGEKLSTRLRRRRATGPSFLFASTRENLGDDREAWLSWWDGARLTYPKQIVPRQTFPLGKLRITKGEPEPRLVNLDSGVMFSLGRDEKAKVPLNSVSVSRLHATILRLNQRLVIRDEGSRFGTMLNGAPVRYAFLSPGDRIQLGKVEMVYEAEEPPPVTADMTWIDPDAFFVLEEMANGSVAVGLVLLLELEANLGWVGDEAKKLFEDAAKAKALEESVRKIYAERAKKAREALAKILGPCEAGTPAAWRALLETKLADLPHQVAPSGWFHEVLQR